MTDTHPFPGTWWIESGKLLGGCYPGDLDPTRARDKLEALLDIGVRTILCLQPETERGQGGKPFARYDGMWQELASQDGLECGWQRHPIPDMGTTDPDRMRAILDAIDGDEGLVYVHCWGGHGRTGTVAGCWLVRHGSQPDEALRINQLARAHDPLLAAMPSPQTEEQVAFVHEWADREGADRAEVSSAASGASAPRDRPLGALLGMAVGDALGTSLEFERPGPKPWSPLLDGPHRTVTGGGPFTVKAGQVTDDTQMACCLAASLVERGGFDADDVGERYREWVGQAFDRGRQTLAALGELGRSGDAATSGLEVWRASGRRSAGNGSLMRTTPIGVLIGDPGARRDASLRDSAITHADPRCCLACAAFNAAIAAGIGGAEAEAMLEAATVELAPAAASLRELWPDEAASIEAGRAELVEDLELAQRADPELYGSVDMQGAAMGFVRVGFRVAFWELLHASSYEQALIDVVNRGGDTDTNGAITGALLGALHGSEGIPGEWREAVLGCVPRAPWDGIYHPRVLVEALAGSGP